MDDGVGAAEWVEVVEVGGHGTFNVGDDLSILSRILFFF